MTNDNTTKYVQACLVILFLLCTTCSFFCGYNLGVKDKIQISNKITCKEMKKMLEKEYKTTTSNISAVK